MSKKLLYGLMVLILLVATLVTACQSSTTSSTTKISTATSTTSHSTVSTSSAPATTTATTATQTNWWDKYGDPQYGGSITYCSSGLMGVNFDPISFIGEENDIWFETLFEPDWTLDRSLWAMTSNFAPDQYYAGQMAESWEETDPTTITVKIRQGVTWQNKAPVNGREFTAYDVQAHYERILGQGKFEGNPSPLFVSFTTNWDTVTATDKYTAVFKFKAASAQNFQAIADRFSLNQFEAPEWVALKSGDVAVGELDPLQDWHNAVGTGAWMLEEYVDGSAFNYVKNPDYWGYDPRHPENKLPYADTLSLIVIQDVSTRTAALRTGKIDTLGGGGNTTVGWQQADNILKSNPDMEYTKVTNGSEGCLFRVDKEPFTDINVRKAMNMAIDREAIAKSIYGGNATGLPVGLVTATMKGYAYDYADWPQSLKDDYAYNPAKAKQLLADAGYPNGFKTSTVKSGDTQLLEAFKAMLAEINVDMEIKVMDSAALESWIRDGKVEQMSSKAGGGQNFPPTRIINMFWSKSTEIIQSGTNDSVYDSMRDQFWAATTAEEAMHFMQECDKRAIEQFWTIGAGENFAYVMWQPWLKGYSGEAAQWSQGVMWSRLWIDQSLKK